MWLLATLMGCGAVVLDDVPAGATSQAPEELVGTWSMEYDGEVAAHAEIAPEGSVRVTFDPGTPEAVSVDVTTWWGADGTAYLDSDELGAAWPGREQVGVDLLPEGSWYPLWYAVAGDTLVVQRADAELAAAALVQGRIDGKVRCSANEGVKLLSAVIPVGAADLLEPALLSEGTRVVAEPVQVAARRTGRDRTAR